MKKKKKKVLKDAQGLNTIFRSMLKCIFTRVLSFAVNNVRHYELCHEMGYLTSPQIRKAWDDRKTVKQNLQDMGLSPGTKGLLPIKATKASVKHESPLQCIYTNTA